MFAHAHASVVSGRCRFAPGGLRQPEAGAARPRPAVQARHQRHRDHRRCLQSGEQAGHRGDRRSRTVLGQAVLRISTAATINPSRVASSPSCRRRGKLLRHVRPMPRSSPSTPTTARARTSSRGMPRCCSRSSGTSTATSSSRSILAHEWGHAIQARSNFTARTVTRELQADCFAGAWSKHAQDDGVFDVTSADLDGALAGLLDVRDTPAN